MAWVAVNKDGSETISIYEPYRTNKDTWNCNTEAGDGWDIYVVEQISSLKRGTIEKILGYKLTWEDNPIEV